MPTWSDWSQAGCCQGGAPVTSWYLEDNLQTFQKYIWYISKDGGVLQSWLKLKEEVMVFPWVNHGVFRFSQTPKVVGQGTHALPSAPGIDPFGALHKYIYIYIYTNKSLLISVSPQQRNFWSVTSHMNSNPTFLPQLASKSRPTIPHPLPQLCQKGPCPNVHVDALFLARFHMISSILVNPHLGLSENSVPLHPMVNDHYPY